MSITLDLAGTNAAAVKVAPSPLAETMATLHVLTAVDHHPESSALVQEVSGKVDDLLREEMWQYSPLWARLRCRLFFPISGEPDSSWTSEINRLGEIHSHLFADAMAEGILGLGRKGDASSWRQNSDGFLLACGRRSYERYALARRLVEDPEDLRLRMIEFLERCWDAFMEEIWLRTHPDLARAAFLVREKLAVSIVSALQGLSPTATAMGDSRVRFDKLDTKTVRVARGPLYVIPSMRTWPHLTIKHSLGLPPVLIYPAREAGSHLSMHELGLRLGALNSPQRLEICRHLLGEPITTTELGVRLGISDSQVSRALTQLRNCGLVASERVGGQLRHRVVVDAVKRLGLDVMVTITR